jgi:hypothetical protein
MTRAVNVASSTIEQGTDTKAIVAEKQRLRDITKISVTTLDELKGLSA